MNIRKPYDRNRVITTPGGESITDTSQGNDTDVNRIVARFSRTGELPPNTSTPQYADVTALQGEKTELLERGRRAAEELAQVNAKISKAKKEQLLKDQEELKQLREQQKQNDETNKTQTE